MCLELRSGPERSHEIQRGHVLSRSVILLHSEVLPQIGAKQNKIKKQLKRNDVNHPMPRPLSRPRDRITSYSRVVVSRVDAERFSEMSTDLLASSQRVLAS